MDHLSYVLIYFYEPIKLNIVGQMSFGKLLNGIKLLTSVLDCDTRVKEKYIYINEFRHMNKIKLICNMNKIKCNMVSQKMI